MKKILFLFSNIYVLCIDRCINIEVYLVAEYL